MLGTYKYRGYQMVAARPTKASEGHTTLCWFALCVSLPDTQFHALLAIGAIERADRQFVAHNT